MPIKQFLLEFSKNKNDIDRTGKKTVVSRFDKELDVGVVVSQHEGRDDYEGERVDMQPRGDGVFCYKVHDGFTIVVRLGLEQDATAKLLQPVLVQDDGVEEAYPPFDILPGEKYQLPNLEMDANEGPNYWIIKENDEIVLTIMIHV